MEAQLSLMLEPLRSAEWERGLLGEESSVLVIKIIGEVLWTVILGGGHTMGLGLPWWLRW